MALEEGFLNLKRLGEFDDYVQDQASPVNYKIPGLLRGLREMEGRKVRFDYPPSNQCSVSCVSWEQNLPVCR